MTKGALQPMQTSRLMQCAAPISCYICEAENTLEAEFCYRCAAPMALAHQVRSHQVQPRMVAVVGASGAGKTVYLGMLMDMLSRQPQRLQLLTRGAFSVSLQQATIAALARCEFPHKTANEPDRWNWVHAEVRRVGQHQAIDLVMPDMAGEAVLEEVEHPHTYEVIRALLRKSSAALVLIDAVPLAAGNRDPDYFTMKLLSYLSEVEPSSRSGWSARPVALALTKSDQVEACRADAAGFARTHAAGVWQICRQRFAQHKFFAVSLVGACAWRVSSTLGPHRAPLRIEPHGVVEPFEWILTHWGE